MGHMGLVGDKCPMQHHPTMTSMGILLRKEAVLLAVNKCMAAQEGAVSIFLALAKWASQQDTTTTTASSIAILLASQPVDQGLPTIHMATHQ